MRKDIDLSVKSKYYVHNSESTSVKYCWLVAHGYAQLAEFFIRHFKVLNDEHLVVAPEGLHRFYIQGSSGRVGASWMTKLDREQDIKQYVQLLENVMSEECPQKETINIAFGFSQGAATISRWICNTNFSIDVLVLWAGAWPSDMDIPLHKEKLLKMKVFVVVGTADQYLGEEGVSKYLNSFDENNIPYTLIRFDGDHRLDKEVILGIANAIGVDNG